MGPADYRMMSEATGQRIAAALEALSGTGAAAAAARTNLDVYSKGETDTAIAQSTANLAPCKIISSSSKATHVLNLASGTRHMIVALSTQASSSFCVTASVSSAGAVTILELGKGGNVTLTTSTNTLTCTMTASNGLLIADFAIYGDFVTVS